MCQGQWIHWEPHQKFDGGKAIISSGGDPASTGLFQLYHFHQINFEASIEWRSGDTVEVPPGSPEVLLYTVREDSAKPLILDIRLTHRLGHGTLQLVNGESGPIPASVLCGNVASEDAGDLTYKLQIYSAGIELDYHKHQPGGIDFATAPGITFADRPQIERLKDAKACRLEVTDTGVVGRPEQIRDSYLCATSFGMGGPSWDRIVITLASGDQPIKGGTQFWFMLAGAPLGPSKHALACTADRLPPLVFLDHDAPVDVPLTGLRLSGAGDSVRYFTLDQPEVLVAVDRTITPSDGQGKLAFQLAPSPLGASDLIVELSSGGFVNVQATTVYNFRQYRSRRIIDLLESAWARQPGKWVVERPGDRPMWESTISLCDKLDPNDEGLPIAVDGGMFYASCLNFRRTAFGHFVVGGSMPLPAVWRQGFAAPEIVSQSTGAILCCNDQLQTMVGGYRIDRGVSRPCIWRRGEGSWGEVLLPTLPFASSGRVLAINNRGRACGYVEILIGEHPRRLPILWQTASEETQFDQPVVLPLPAAAMAGAALGLNQAGQVVGYYLDKDGIHKACRWEGGAFVDLNTEGVATAVNVVGIVVGHGPDGPLLWQGGESHLLSEIPGATVLNDVHGLTAFGDLLGSDALGRRWICEPESLLKW